MPGQRSQWGHPSAGALPTGGVTVQRLGVHHLPVRGHHPPCPCAGAPRSAVPPSVPPYCIRARSPSPHLSGSEASGTSLTGAGQRPPQLLSASPPRRRSPGSASPRPSGRDSGGLPPAVPGAAGVGCSGAEEELEPLELPHVAPHAVVQDGGQEAAGRAAARHAAALTRNRNRLAARNFRFRLSRK